MRGIFLNYKKLLIICLGLVVMLAISHYKDIDLVWDYMDDGVISEETLLGKKARKENCCFVSDQQGIRDRQYSYHAINNTYVFFSYSKGSLVDAYDHKGIYQFTIILPDSQNGVVSIRCDGNLLYVSSKQDVVYVFEGKEQVDYFTDDEAELVGYDWRWFDNQPGLEKDKDYIYLRDENGNIVLKAKIPGIVRNA